MPERHRVALSLSPFLARGLAIWAEKEGTKAGTLASSIVEMAIREAIKTGQIPNPAQDVVEEGEDLPVEFLRMLAEGEAPTDATLIKLASELEIEEERLFEMRDRIMSPNCCEEGSKC